MFTGFLHPKLSPERSLDWSAGVLDRGWRGLAEDGRRRRAGRGGEQTLWSFGRPPPPSSPLTSCRALRWSVAQAAEVGGGLFEDRFPVIGSGLHAPVADQVPDDELQRQLGGDDVYRGKR